MPRAWAAHLSAWSRARVPVTTVVVAGSIATVPTFIPLFEEAMIATAAAPVEREATPV
ncbi:MAG: hypothetical protein RMM58_08150 [Chloroflexota bacterium]|nr:hypothetical protein [Dehalococcoidia bacterium]MDW8253834.1 hypothetical protein [Chloroflexota bacterium]